jgi:decaprenyl-phosphate phosphoribosyltransferase
LRDYVKIARPGHWTKNVFVLPGALAAAWLAQPIVPATIGLVAAAIAATCLAASANYVINEWLDARSDAYHPLKNSRPAVRGSVTPRGVLVEYVALVFGAIAVGLFVSPGVTWTLVALLVMGLAYNVPPVRLKDRVYADVLSESVNNALRLLIGWFAVTSLYWPPISLVVGYWMGGAYLMAVKRLAEYRMIGDPERAALYRSSFAKYTEASLIVSAMLYAMVATFLLGTFLIKYRIEYVLAMPAMWGLFCWYLILGFREGSVAQRPESLFKERGLVLIVIVLVVLILGLTFIDIPAIQGLAGTSLIQIGGW